MKGRSALPRLAFVLGLLAVTGVVAVSLWGRRVLRHVASFNVRQVEVVGAAWVAPDAVLRLAAIGRERSVWDDFSEVERRLARHPLIEEARVERAGWRGLRIVIAEVEPLAFVGMPDLRAVRSDGTLLPIDPLDATLDLPLLTMAAELGEDSLQLKAGTATLALQKFGTLKSLDPGLAAVVSDFELRENDVLILNLLTSQAAKQVALRGGIDERLLRRVRATLADLRGRGIDAALVEARYADIILVRRERL
jgi:cell division septal protein FtsQ